MSFAFGLGALLFAAGLAPNGLTQLPPPLPGVPAAFGNLIPTVTTLGSGISSFASGGNAGTLTQALVCLVSGRFFPTLICFPRLLGSLL